jgi:outer membrane receptor protein involved in Fe transport
MAMTTRLPLPIALAWLAAFAGAAEGTVPTGADDAAPGDDLSQFSDLPVVVSASRGKRQLNQSPVPVSVVTADDLRLGGYTTVAEALMFTPGVDVAPADRNHWMVGVRGLHEVFSDRTLTMVDGMVADNPFYGGSQFQRLPVAIDDIDHIEVVRGPGGAAWGANAFNGVINLITLAPEDALGTRVGLTVDDFGDLSTSARWGDFSGPLSWRMTVGYQEQRSSQDALGKSDPGATYVASRYDDSQRVLSDGELRWHAGSTTDLRLDLGYSYSEEGSFSVLGTQSEQTARIHMLRAAAILDQGMSEQASLHTTLFTDYQDSFEPDLLHYRVGEYGAESQIDLALGRGHTTSLGGGLRLTHIHSVDHGDPEDFVLDGGPLTESRVGLFAIDHWQLLAPLSLESQARVDRYSGTGADWAGRMAALYAVDDDRDHVLRMAVARAYRAPLVSVRDTHTTRLGGAVQFDGADLDDEQTWIAELGWTSHLDSGLLLRLDLFYQKYDDLIGYRTDSGSPPINVTPAVLGDAEMWGAEAEVDYSNRAGRWGLWYTWHDFITEHDRQSVRAFQPTTSGVGATSRWNLPARLVGVVNYRFSDVAQAKESPLPSYNRLDLAVDWIPAGNRGEIGIGCHDVLSTSYKEAPLGTFSKYEVPGRTFFLRGELAF